jgi:hypothetical protein
LCLRVRNLADEKFRSGVERTKAGYSNDIRHSFGISASPVEQLPVSCGYPFWRSQGQGFVFFETVTFHAFAEITQRNPV